MGEEDGRWGCTLWRRGGESGGEEEDRGVRSFLRVGCWVWVWAGGFGLGHWAAGGKTTRSSK